jgi:hypothetical protein
MEVNLRIKGPFSAGLLISEMFVLPIKDENFYTKHFSILHLSSTEESKMGRNHAMPGQSSASEP